MKFEFMRLIPLVGLFKDGAGNPNDSWVINVTEQVGKDALGLASSTDLQNGDELFMEFDCDELEFTDDPYYHFAGSATEGERFYASDEMIFKRKVDDTYWAMVTSELDL